MEVPQKSLDHNYDPALYCNESDALLLNKDSNLSPPDIYIQNVMSDDEDNLTYETDPGCYGGQTSDESDFEKDNNESTKEEILKDSKIHNFLKKHWSWNNSTLKKRKKSKSGYATDTCLQEKSVSALNLREGPCESRRDSLLDHLFYNKKSRSSLTGDNEVVKGNNNIYSVDRRGSMQEVCS